MAINLLEQNDTENFIKTTVKESQNRIKRSLVEGFEYDHLVIAKSDRFLRQHNRQKLAFAVIYVDLVSSTVMSTEVTPDFLSQLVMVFSQEISFVIEKFGGLVLKFVGDSIIGYFPYNSDSESIISCGQSVIRVVLDAINPLLLQMGYKGIHVKVTADYGSHTVIRYGSDVDKSHVDIISATLNLAAKMQSVTKPDEMVIGRGLYNRLNKEYKALFEAADLKWNYHYLKEYEPYQLY